MNEVTKIHLGRQAFTAAVDAYGELKAYLDAISRQVKDKDVVEEVEARMVELLSERGITQNKVILSSDVNYLKAQLGSPKDFGTEEASDEELGSDLATNKRLFRDTDNAIIAGVASGLAKYFGLDVTLIRILFIVFVLITIGWGLLLYILLWLLVPEAKTTSDKLQMEGKSVTIGSLKQVVENADLKSAAKRANRSLADFINSLFKVIVKIAGLGFIIGGLSILLGLVAFVTYFLAKSSAWTESNIFPIGFRENLLLGIALSVAILLAVFIVLFGIALFRRAWPIKAWITGLLAGLIFICLATGGALTADVYPTVRSAYNSNVQTSYRTLSAFNSVENSGNAPININFEPSSSYYVSLNYYGHPNLKSIKTTVQNKTLLIDYNHFTWTRNCPTFCIPGTYMMTITVFSPNALQLINQGDPFYKPDPAMPVDSPTTAVKPLQPYAQ